MTVRIKLMEAIACKRVVTAEYNAGLVRLAPHQLFERHGDLFVGALNMSKNWRAGDEQRLGYFKLSGLSAITLLDEEFVPLPAYQAVPPRSDDTMIFSI